ncbi:alpha/beta hydrolase [SAR92 clade bacterium H246]
MFRLLAIALVCLLMIFSVFHYIDPTISMTVAAFIIGSINALLLIRKRLKNNRLATYSVDKSIGIEVLECLEINGTKQWVHIRGQNRENPVLLFLHGGPGAPHIGWFDEIQRPWENDFTVVQWDQRQAGKSYMPMKMVGDTMSHKTMISDAEAVIEYLRKRLGVDKLFLMGTSYGTYLGAHIAKQRPEWLYAYIAVGQVVNMREHAKREHELLLDNAQKKNDKKQEEILKQLMPFPSDDDPVNSFFSNVGFLLDSESRLGKCFPMSLADIMGQITLRQFMSPLYTWRDMWNKFYGDAPAVTNNAYQFGQQFMDYDLPGEIGNDFEVPILFLTGKHDWHVASDITDRWFNQISAPYKNQVWFNESAHMAYVTEPGRFWLALVEYALPLANREGCSGNKRSIVSRACEVTVSD